MVYSTETPLPPIFGMVIYYTHPEASPEHADLAGFYYRSREGDSPHRLEFFFLPGASDDDCINHYREEKASRGDTRLQIAAVENNSGSEGRLPGLVHSYLNPDNKTFQSALFICKQRDWNDGDQVMRYIAFDPSQEEWEKAFDPGQAPPPPTMEVKDCPIFIPEDVRSANPDVKYQMDVMYLFFVYLHNLSQEPLGMAFRRAESRGWTTW